MRFSPIYILFIAAAASMLMAGCSSSNTAQQEGTTDSTSSQPQQPLTQKQPQGKKSSLSQNQQGFVTQEDTIEAEVVTRNQGASHLKPPPKRSAKKKFYSVQLGAFRILSNADHAKRVAKERYKKPIYHFYDKAIKMYRVTVGNFSTLKNGLSFLKEIQKKHPKEYKDAWVAEMRR